MSDEKKAPVVEPEVNSENTVEQPEQKQDQIELKVGDVFLAAYDDRHSVPSELTEFKIISISKYGIKLDNVNSINKYDDKVKWYNKAYFDRNYVIVELIESAE